MKKETGGLAFPHEYGSTAPGMTLRDYFAAKALQGFMIAATNRGQYMPPDAELAIAAYTTADAMLEARNQ